MAMLAVASMTIGLLISALVNSSDKTMPLLVVVVLVAGRAQRRGVHAQRQGRPGAVRLALAVAVGLRRDRVDVDLNQISPAVPGIKPDPLWNHGPHIWLLEMALQLALMAVFIALTWRRLGSAGPARRR